MFILVANLFSAKYLGITFAFLVLAATGGCGATTTTSQDQAINKSNAHQVYIPKNDIEFKNYNQRQLISDDPTTILWCTSAFPVPGAPLFTVPIVGKLTSGNKRPYSTSYVSYQSSYNPEIPGPDGMYGASGEYRYGFTPNGVYSDFYNLATYCTTEPMIWQKDATTIVLQSDPDLLAAQNKARTLISQGKTQEAQQVLLDAVSKIAKKG